MSEMLGNQYFISRRYDLAQFELHKSLLNSPDNYCIKKKLVICNIKIGRIKRAFNYFRDLVTNDIGCFFESNYRNENCPCTEMIYEFETSIENISEFDRYLILGMLWMYLNVEESIRIFKILKGYNRFTNKIDLILTKLIQTKNNIIRGQ